FYAAERLFTGSQALRYRQLQPALTGRLSILKRIFTLMKMQAEALQLRHLRKLLKFVPNMHRTECLISSQQYFHFLWRSHFSLLPVKLPKRFHSLSASLFLSQCSVYTRQCLWLTPAALGIMQKK